MLTQSKEVQNAWRASQRTLDIKVTIDGKTYGATDINSLKYDSGAYNGDTFAIGSTYSNTVQIEFSHLVEGLKLGMEVHPSIGIKTSSGYVYEPLGVFIISSEIKMDRNNNLTTVSASDRFCGLEGTYVSKLTYPAKVLDVIAEICAQSGVKANTDDLARLPHQADLPAPITGQSYRKALGWIAQLYVGYALFDRQGLFTIRTISEPNYELDPSQYEQAGLTKNEAAYKINGIQCQVTLTTKTRDGESTEETKNYQAGDATGSQIKLENNIMTPQRLNDIWEQLKDITFYPFSLNWFGNPAVEAGDWLRLEDKQGNSFVVPNSSYTLDFNGGLSATSKADQTTSSDQMVPWQGSVAQTIKELQLRRLPDGTVVFPPSVTEPPTNAKFNDVWFKKNGNSTELWIFEKQDDGAGKWIRKDLSDDEIKKKVADAQQGLNQAKADIIANKQKADADVENLNKSIEDNKKVADESLQKLNDSVTNLQGQYDNSIVPNLNKVMADASDALQKYIAAQNSIADLTKQAQQQGKDIADVSNTVKGLNINYANLAGDVNSTKVDVKGLQTTVGTANGDIAQLKLDAQNLQTMLAGKVDNTTYTNFVNLTNQALQAKLTASDLNGYAKTTDVQATANGLKLNIDSVTDRINNLRIGSRNLLHDTSDQYKTLINDNGGGWLQKTTASTNMTSVANYHSGDQFTYAATVNNTSSQSVQLEIQQFDQNYNGIVGTQSSPIPVGTKNYRASMNVQLDENTRFVSTWLIFQGGNGAQGEQIQVKDERLVFGTVSNTWSPNPDDTEHSLTGLSARITANSQQFSSYYTKSETDNKADAAKNDAVNTIKNDGNWQGLSNILTNSGFLQTADGFMQKVQQTTIPIFNGGGVNLVQGTAKFNFPLQSNGGVQSLQKYDNETNYIQHTASQPSFIGPWFGTFTPEIGKTYTISADVAGNGYITGAIFSYEGNDSSTLNRVDLTDNWQRISNTIHVNKISGNWVIYASNSTLLKIKHVKIEEGYVATPWSPSPFDLATQVSFSELSQSLDGLRSTVGSNYGNLQSQISQSSSTVRTELIDKVNGVQNQLTSTADSLSLKITNLKIGARNLLHNTSDQYRTLTGDGWMGVHTSSDEYTSVASYHNGSLFTYAATISNTSDVPVELQVWRCDQNKNRLTNGRLGISAYVYPGQKDVRVFLTGSIDNNTWYLQSAVYSSDGQSGQHTIQVKDERLVEGAYAGTWSSNPNDVAKNIIDLNATLQGLQSTVSGNYGNLQSQINQTATTLRGEVTDKVNGLQGQITTQANNINLMLGTAGDLSNICRNPTFDNHDGWTDSVHVESNWSEIPTKNCGVLFTRDGYYGKEFTVVPGDRYYTSVFANNQNDGDFVLGLHFKMKDGSDQWLSGSRIGARECRQALGSITVPDNAVTANIWASIQKLDNFGFTRFTNVIVKKNDTLAQINMSAGTTLIQNDKIYMDASSTIFSGNAFIPSAAITSLNADKITAGTINGAKVNVINLNANNITAGTLRGSNGEFYLDSGALHVWQNNHDAWIDQNGIHDYDNQGNNIWISRGSISAYGNSSGAYLFDGGLYLHKSQSLSDAVLDPDYGSITKSDNIVSFGTSGLDIEGKDGFLLRTHGWNDQTLSYLNGNEIIGAGIAGKSDGFINIAAKKQLFLYAGEPIQNNNLKTIPNLVLDGTYQNGQTVLKGTFSQYFFQGPSSGFSGGITLQDEFVNVGSLNGKNYFSINSDGAITITANGKSILSLNGLFPGVNSDFNVRGNFAVTGSKNAIVPTSRGMTAINAYETAEYYFGDIGETQTNSNGVVTVMIDPYFLETVNTLVPYQVFLTSYGDGNVWVSSRSANNFTVKSSNPNIHFAWEIKAKRKGYENDRMKIVKGVFNNEQY
ncbi:hypothetical protein [Limosilactobacillus reuteri]|uniref:hypothetical protein n=3 Tax=Limosilactobacillus reuteri TaxID=1598 RepID=UPI001CDD2F29|nr:hypothetical protein [Limosilactobacillus reuteri]